MGFALILVHNEQVLYFLIYFLHLAVAIENSTIFATKKSLPYLFSFLLKQESFLFLIFD